jgi:hypothetical protein
VSWKPLVKWRNLRQQPDSALGANGRLLVPGAPGNTTTRAAQSSGVRGLIVRFTRPLLLAIAAIALLAGGLGLGRATAPRGGSGPRYPDGTNPMTTECPISSQLVDRVPITVPANHLFGWVELRRAADCRMAWGRVVPLPGEPITGPIHMVVRIVRPADSRQDEYAYSKPTSAVFTNMLSDGTACVYAEGQVTVDGEESAVVRTACRQAD